MTWTAVVPIKAPADRKQRLAAILDPDQRERLTHLMLCHVLEAIGAIEGLERIVVSPTPPASWSVAWHPDSGPLNMTLDLLRRARLDRHLLVVNADLPSLEAADLLALMAAAFATGLAIAPDRHGRGTNAVAARAGQPLQFCFGPDSAAAFHRANVGAFTVVSRPGLANDIDTPDDLARLAAGPEAPHGIVDIWRSAVHF